MSTVRRGLAIVVAIFLGACLPLPPDRPLPPPIVDDDDVAPDDDDDVLDDDDSGPPDDDDSAGDDDDSAGPTDADEDGVSVEDGDCDDGDPAVYPGATEVCGDADLDCDQLQPECPATCAETLTAAPGTTSGAFVIDADGRDSASLTGTTTWCDMDTDGGGWTLIMRTVWDPTETAALLTGFVDWRDVALGDPTNVADAYRLPGAFWPVAATLGDWLVTARIRKTDGGECSPLFYNETGATISLTAASAFVTYPAESVFFVRDQLSTLDTGPAQEFCVDENDAAPWFYLSCCSVCPTMIGVNGWDVARPSITHSYVAGGDMNGADLGVCGGAETEAAGGLRGVGRMDIFAR